MDVLEAALRSAGPSQRSLPYVDEVILLAVRVLC